MEQNYQKIGDYITVIDNRNSNGAITNLMGISIDKCYIPSVANVIGTDLNNYKVIRKGQFACSLMQVSRDQRIPLAMYTSDEPAIMSPAYVMFEVNRSDELLPEYMELWFKRAEFDREASFYAVGGVRGSLDWEDFCKMKLPVPSISEQCKIVHDYQVITERIELLRKVNKNLEEQMMAIYRNHFVDFQPFSSDSFKNTKLGDIPVSWRTGKLSEICEMLNGRAYSQDEMLLEGKYKLLRVGNFFTNDFWYYSDLELDNNKYCYPGDLLFCWAATIGLYIWNEPKTIYHYHIWKVDFSRSSSLYREYVYLCLTNEIANMKNAGHGSIMLHLTKENVENMEIIIPPFQTIKEFHNIIVLYINQRNIIQKELDVLAGLKEEVLSNWKSMGQK